MAHAVRHAGLRRRAGDRPAFIGHLRRRSPRCAAGVYVTGALGTADVRRFNFNGVETGAFGTGSLWGSDIVLDASGVYVFGLPCPVACQFAATLRKFDRNGEQLWNRDLPQGFESGASVALEGDSLYVTGFVTHNFPDGPFNTYVRKYDTNGKFIWNDEFGADSGGTNGYAIAADASGYYLTGDTSGTFPGQTQTPYNDVFVIKRNEDPVAQAHLLSLGDINRDGTPELAAVGHDPRKQVNWVVVKDANTHLTLRKVTIADPAPAADVRRVPDLNGNGSPEIAVLSATTAQAQVRDSLSGALLGSVPFDASFEPVRLASVPARGAGAPMLARLERKNGTVRVELRNAPGGGLWSDGSSMRRRGRFVPKDLVGRAGLQRQRCGGAGGAPAQRRRRYRGPRRDS